MYWGSLTMVLPWDTAKIWEMAVLLIFLLQFLSILSNLVLAKIGARFGDTPNQARSGPINWDQPNQTQLGVNVGDAPNQRPDFGDAPISHNAKKRCNAAALCLPR
jgi:hypothetical protein